jgi:hypothetical protein
VDSPLYGIEGQGWFLGLHTFTHYVKVAFFRGASLRPVPPGANKGKDMRYIDIHEGDGLDEAQMANSVKQAAALAGFLGPRPLPGHVGPLRRASLSYRVAIARLIFR